MNPCLACQPTPETLTSIIERKWLRRSELPSWLTISNDRPDHRIVEHPLSRVVLGTVASLSPVGGTAAGAENCDRAGRDRRGAGGENAGCGRVEGRTGSSSQCRRLAGIAWASGRYVPAPTRLPLVVAVRRATVAASKSMSFSTRQRKSGSSSLSAKSWAAVLIC